MTEASQFILDDLRRRCVSVLRASRVAFENMRDLEQLLEELEQAVDGPTRERIAEILARQTEARRLIASSLDRLLSDTQPLEPIQPSGDDPL